MCLKCTSLFEHLLKYLWSSFFKSRSSSSHQEEVFQCAQKALVNFFCMLFIWLIFFSFCVVTSESWCLIWKAARPHSNYLSLSCSSSARLGGHSTTLRWQWCWQRFGLWSLIGWSRFIYSKRESELTSVGREKKKTAISSWVTVQKYAFPWFIILQSGILMDIS